jgi:hypothetical protein
LRSLKKSSSAPSATASMDLKRTASTTIQIAVIHGHKKIAEVAPHIVTIERKAVMAQE